MFKINSYLWIGGTLATPYSLIRPLEKRWRDLMRRPEMRSWFRLRSRAYPTSFRALRQRTEAIYVGKVPMRPKLVKRIHEMARDHWFGRVGMRVRFLEELSREAPPFSEILETLRHFG